MGGAAISPAQDDFVNYEVPHVKPLTVARVAGHDYLLVCNTPDNSVEIYDTHDDSFVARVPVGLRPVSVFYDAGNASFYTANFLGDSITKVRIEDPGGGQPIRGVPERTVWVGDEPVDIARMPDGLSMIVSLNGSSSYALIDRTTLLPPGNVQSLLRIFASTPIGVPNAPIGLKSPRRILVDGTDLYVLNFKGGNSELYDLDVYHIDLATLQENIVTGLGSDNFGMALGRNGNLYVVGGLARNDVLFEPNVAAVPTGFVESRLWEVDEPGSPAATSQTRDLHRNPDGSRVNPTQAVAQPTDVALLEAGTSLQKVFVTGFGSNSIGVLDANASLPPARWTSRVIRLASHDPVEYPIVGPRGLAMKYAAPGIAGDPGTRLYALNRLDHSLVVIDPFSEMVLDRIPLQNDPTPRTIRLGRRFLYSASLSGLGFVSCASCHIDGRSDSLAWELSTPGAPPQPMPANLIDGMTTIPTPPTQWDARKGFLVTQSLLGLATHPTNPEAQHLFTTDPLHWRGDRADFTSFNGAFVSLLLGQDVGAPQNPQGLPSAQMQQFSDFMLQSMLPPNPRQPLTRRYSGDLGTPGLEDGSGARRGMKLFHERGRAGESNAGRSCVQCHHLPDGSVNKLTSIVGGPMNQPLPLEVPQLRGAFEREGTLEFSASFLSQTVVSEFGLTHLGRGSQTIGSQTFDLPLTANWFNVFSSLSQFPDIFKLIDLTDFVRQFDSGSAPMVGQPHTANLLNVNQQDTTDYLDLAEDQVAESNIGLAVYSRAGGVERGYWFDLTVNPGGYREVGTATVLNRGQLLSQVQGIDDVLIFQGTPPGSERRVADLTGPTQPLAGSAPANLTLEAMAIPPQWEDVPSLSKNWIKGVGPNDFVWDGMTILMTPVAEPVSLKALRIFQQALIANAPGLGLTAMHHEAPRRFRVAGTDIRHGAKMQLRVPIGAMAPPYVDPLTDTLLIELPLHPTAEVNGAGHPIWETHATADPKLVYMLMLGGPNAPGVADAVAGLLPEPSNGVFQPLTWNLHHLTVVNADGTSASPASWQSVTIQ